MSEKNKQHFVLVHGACHGAWCWYKLKPLLEASGHRVTVLDLAASGLDITRSITDISTCEQYSEPLMQLMTSLPNDEKVVLVGHSFGGLSLAMAMDKFPDKISVSVFLTAFMPDTKHSPSFVMEKPVVSWRRSRWWTWRRRTFLQSGQGEILEPLPSASIRKKIAPPAVGEPDLTLAGSDLSLVGAPTPLVEDSDSMAVSTLAVVEVPPTSMRDEAGRNQR